MLTHSLLPRCHLHFPLRPSPTSCCSTFWRPHLTAPFTSDLGVPPGRLGGSVRCPPFLLPGVLNFKLSNLFPSFLILSPRHPSRATLACRLVVSVGVLVTPPCLV